MQYRAPPPEVKFCIEADIHLEVIFGSGCKHKQIFHFQKKKIFLADFRG
jgi:hypothetical protein